MKKQTESLAQKISWFLFLGLLGYMPLHILLSTWIGTSFGVLEFTRVAKELVLVFGAGLALLVGWKRGAVQKLSKDRLLWLIAGFIGLNILLSLFRNTDPDAELLGLVYNVRFLVFFVWAAILARLYEPVKLIQDAVRVVLVAGGVVVAFGLFQYLLLPDNALRHLGYERANGVLPAFFIDDKPDFERIMSTLRDPNSLGSYLLILLGFASVRALAHRSAKRKAHYMVYSLLILLAIFLTFSRAAWIGAFLTLGVVGLYMVLRQRIRFKVYKVPSLFAALIALVLIVTTVYTAKDTYVFKNVVFHADESTVLEDPNELRVRFWQESIEDIATQPIGSGPGTAGLASIRNDERTVLNENYYFQTAQEAGILGFILFMAILLLVAKRLFVLAKRQHLIAISLLASLAGLMITNFLAHIWANEAVAYTWWGLAGLVLYADRGNDKAKKS